MAKLPQRSPDPTRLSRRGRTRLPDAGDIRSQSAAGGGPVPRVPDLGGGGFEVLAESANKFAAQLAVAEENNQKRVDAITGLRLSKELDEFSKERISTFEFDGDPSDESQLKSVRSEIENKRRELEAQASVMSPDGVINLRGKMDRLQSKYDDAATSLTFKAQNTMGVKALDQDKSDLNAQLENGEILLDEAIIEFSRTVDELKPTLKVDQEKELLTQGVAEFVETEINKHLNNNDAAAAAAVFEEEGGNLSPKKQRELSNRITKKEGLVDEGKRKGEQEVAKVAAILKRDPASFTDEEREEIAGLSAMNPSERIAFYERKTGQRANAEMVAQALGMRVPETEADSLFGRGVRGKSLEAFVNHSRNFGLGLTSEKEDLLFQAAASDYIQGVPYTDELGRQRILFRTLPTYVVEAFQQRGIPLPTRDVQQPPTPGTPIAGQQPSTAQPTPQKAARDGGEMTMFDMALKGNIAGPVTSLLETAGETPVLGQLFNPKEITQQRATYRGHTRELVRALQDNPKYAIAEREDIIKNILKIEPKAGDTRQALLNRQIGMDAFLRKREENAYKTSESAVSKDERLHARNVFNAIRQFRDTLGAPPRITNAQEYEALDSGSVYIDPTGEIKVKR